jgi:hypothetical protein
MNYSETHMTIPKEKGDGKDYVVITAVSMYRMRYVMHKDDLRVTSPGIRTTLTNDSTTTIIAKNMVTMNECEEFSQEHIGEHIIEDFDMTETDILALFDKENDYISEWTREQKLELIRKANNG